MPSSNVCWGIEIGAGAIKAVKLEASGDGARVLDFVVLPHKKVLSTPDLDQNDALRVALGMFAGQVDLTGASVAISVPGHSAFARFAKLPPVEPRKVPDIVKFEAVQQIPFPIDQVEWDYQTFQSPDSPDIEVGIFAITRDRIMERLAIYEDVGIVPDYVTLSPVAAYNAMAYDLQFTEKTPGTIILDIGTTSTDLIIAEAGRVWIRTFPIGGHHFTEALVNGFQLSYPKAEKLKREAESSKHARHIFQQMRPVFGDLAQDVQRSIGYYQSLHKDAKLERLIGLGSTFRLPGLRKYLKQQLQIDVFRMEQFKRLSLDGPRAGEFQSMTLNLATAYGLALQGLGMATLEANLMPAGVIKEAMWKRKTKWFGVAAGIAIAGSIAMFYRPFHDNVEVSDNPPAPIIKEVLSAAQRYKTEAADLTSATIGNTAATDTMALLENRDIYAKLLGDVGQMLAAAQTKATPVTGDKPGTPAFAVAEYKTLFVPPGSADAQQPAAPPPTDPNAPNLASQPKIQVSLTLTTTQPDAQKFAISTIGQWLKDNAKRANMPYELVVAGNPIVKVKEDGGDARTDTPGGGSPGRIDTSAGGVIPGDQYVPGQGIRGAYQVTGGGMEGGGKGGARGVAPSAGPGGSAPYTPSFSQPGSPPTPPDQPDQRAQQALELIKRSAPLPGNEPLAAGVRRTTFAVTYSAVLVPKAKPEGGAN